jgi:hypothetical protein
MIVDRVPEEVHERNPVASQTVIHHDVQIGAYFADVLQNVHDQLQVSNMKSR